MPVDQLTIYILTSLFIKLVLDIALLWSMRWTDPLITPQVVIAAHNNIGHIHIMSWQYPYFAYTVQHGFLKFSGKIRYVWVCTVQRIIWTFFDGLGSCCRWQIINTIRLWLGSIVARSTCESNTNIKFQPSRPRFDNFLWTTFFLFLNSTSNVPRSRVETSNFSTKE